MLLNECIKHCLHLLNPRIEAKEIRVVTDLDYDFVVLAEEVSLINSVLMNLLTNAIKFSHKGGVITVSALEDEESTCLRIIDEGTGIPEAMIPHLFNVEKGKSMKGTGGEKGSGFGLPLVKKFMTAYGGTIEMANREEGGAESKLTFPLLHEEAEDEL